MKRPLCVVGCSVLITLAVSFSFHSEQNIQLAVAATVTGFLFLVLKKSYSHRISVICFSVCIGFLLGGYYQHQKVEPFANINGQEVEITAFVKEVSSGSGRGKKYRVRAAFAVNLPESEIILRDYNSLDLTVGETFTGRVKLQQPKYRSVQDFYRREGIPIEGVLLSIETVSATPVKWGDKLFFQREKLRKGIEKKNNQVLPDTSNFLVNGMVFGLTDEIDATLYNDLNRAGTSHLVSVSGLHLSIVTGFLLWIFEKIRLPRKTSYLLAILGVIGFSFLIGGSPPILRSCTMTVLFLLAKICWKDSDSLVALGVSALIISIWKPYWVLSKGLWLSFFATAGIILFAQPFNQWLRKRYVSAGKTEKIQQSLCSILSVSFAAYLFTFPIIVLTNGYLPLLSPLANILVSPFSSIVVVGGILIALLPTGFPFYPFLLWLVDISSKMILGISKLFSASSLSILAIDSNYLWIAFLLVIAIVLCCGILYFKKGKNIVAIGVLLSIICLSVGQGITVLKERNKIEMVLLESENTTLFLRGNHCVMIGTPNYYQIGKVQTYLEFRGIKHIDALLMPTYNGTTNSGYPKLQEHFDIHTIFAPDEEVLLETLAKSFPNVRVYGGKLCNIQALGNIIIKVSQSMDRIDIYIGEENILITPKKYDIINTVSPYTIIIAKDTEKIAPHIQMEYPLVTGTIYGEQRIYFSITKEESHENNTRNRIK